MYQHKSGAEKRRQKSRLNDALETVLSKTPKLDKYFSKKTSVNVDTASQPQSSSASDSCIVPEDDTINLAAADAQECSEQRIGKPNTLSSTSIQDEKSNRHSDNDDTTNGYCTDIGLWPESLTDDMRQHWVSTGSSVCQNLKNSYPESFVMDNKKRRYCKRSMFTYMHEPTQTVYERNWLCYSDASRKVYCFHCKLFATEITSFSSGYNDWKNASNRLQAHEKSPSHLKAMQHFSNLASAKSRIDHKVARQISAETLYWTSVLERVVEVIKFLSERGLSFRGHDEILGSRHNGNYLGAFELISKFDSFLAAHIEKQRVLQEENRGRRTISYLSSTICNEFIQLMAKMVLKVIISEVQSAKYYSISIDSTPDASKVDRVTCVLRYVPTGTFTPVERFLQFLGTNSHSGEELASVLLRFLDLHNIDIKNCRGQSYDNASNMAGKYNGVQAKIKEVCRYAQFVPCFGHSLNLIGNEAANCSPKAAAFFEFLQSLYNFFASSTHRWTVLRNFIGEAPTLKSLSVTRWSARADAAKALVKGYHEISEALLTIDQDINERRENRHVADVLRRKMQQLEIGILAHFWFTLLTRFNETSMSLQSVELDLNNAVNLMKSLCEYVASLREQFQFFELEGKKLSGCSDYKSASERNRGRSVRLTRFEGPAQEVIQTPRDKFRTDVFLPIIDNILLSFQKRLAAYSSLSDSFGFFHRMLDLNAGELRNAAAKLVRDYPDDLEQSAPEEFVQYAEFARLSLARSPDVKDESTCSFEANLYRLASANDVSISFPNVNIAFRLYLTLLVSNCTGERSFSVLSRVKNELRTTMTDDRLSALSLMAIEGDILRNIDFKSIISEFAKAKSRKVHLSANV